MRLSFLASFLSRCSSILCCSSWDLGGDAARSSGASGASSGPGAGSSCGSLSDWNTRSVHYWSHKLLRSSGLVVVFSVTNSLPPGEDRRCELLHPGLAGHAPPDLAAEPGLVDTAPGGPGVVPRHPPVARRLGLQLLDLDALTGRRAVRPGQRWSVSGCAAAAPGLGLAFWAAGCLVTLGRLGLEVWGQLTADNWTLSSRKLYSTFVCLFCFCFYLVYSFVCLFFGFFLLLCGFSFVVFILESLFSSGNDGFLLTVPTTGFPFPVSSKLSISFIASVVTLVREFQDLLRFPFSVGISYPLGLML